jgi:hypothetical protein
MDLHEESAFAGILNQPPPFHSREILIEQEDKVQAFLRLLCPLLESHKIALRTFDLAKEMAQDGATSRAVRKYTTLHGEFLQLVRGAAKPLTRIDNGRAPGFGGSVPLRLQTLWL